MNNKIHFNETHLLIPIHMLFTNSKGKTKEVPTITKTGNLTTREKKKSIVLIPSNVDHIEVEPPKKTRNTKALSLVENMKVNKPVNNNVMTAKPKVQSYNEDHYIAPRRSSRLMSTTIESKPKNNKEIKKTLMRIANKYDYNNFSLK